MTTPPLDPSHLRRRRLARVDLLKRRLTLASVLGFAAFFGLAAQHAVKGSSSTARRTAATRSAAGAAPTTFFDERGSDFSFGSESSDSQSVAPQSSEPSPPPVAQTSVS